MPRFAHIVLVAAAALAAGARGAESAIFVSTDGNDAWSGALAEVNAAKTDGPFATLSRARDEVRKQRASGVKTALTVHVRGGLYELPQTLTIAPSESGFDGAPTVFRAYNDEKPILIGGRRITNWSVHKGPILKTNVNEQGFAKIYFRQLIMDGKRQHLARYPNFNPNNPYGGGWAYADGKPIPMYQDVPDEPKNTFVFKPEDVRAWSRPEEAEVFVFARFNWWNDIRRIAKLDTAERRITLTANASYPIRPGDRYYVQNVFEELDAPGEWYLDKRDGTLYFWPPAPIENATVCAPTTRTILELNKGTENVQVIGFTIECSEGTAVVLKETKNCLIARNTIRNVGDYGGSGVGVSGANNGVVGNDIHETGSHGVSISGGERKTLTAAGNYADNNYIHHCGVYYKQGCGISLNGVGNRASHNYIHDGPRMGIIFNGNNLVIEYNHIRHMNLETEDTGAVYTGGRDWIGSRGSIIRHNYFHDILGYGKDKDGKWISPHFAWGVYLDDNTGGVDVIGNIITRCSRANIHLHNGRDNLIENNIFVEGGQQQIEYNGWTVTNRMWLQHLPTMIQGYESVAGEPAWKTMRNMDIHPTQAPQPDGTIMTGNRFLRNIVAYANPKTGGFKFRSLPLAKYESDQNVLWHNGLPFGTGSFEAGKALSGNLIPPLDAGAPGKGPAGWNWQEHPEKATAETVKDTGAGERNVLKLSAGSLKDAKGKARRAVYAGPEIPIKPGQVFRLSARMKADKASSKAKLAVQSYISNVYFWVRETDALVGTEWKDLEVVFKVPTETEPGYNAKMEKLRPRLDLLEEGGVLLVDSIALVHCEALDEMESWRQRGFDRNSVLADPLFENPSADDFRLKPASPALKLGFKPIPVEKIGPYKDPLRASWPIQDAEGAREKPL